jgi:hypothetical protein
VTLDGDSAGGIEGAPAAGGADPPGELRRLRDVLARAEATLASLQERCEDLEEDKAHLGRLCVASAQLHASTVHAETLLNLQDVLVNLIGSEEIAVWSLCRDGRTLELRASQGVDADAWRSVTVGEGVVGKAAASGELLTPGPAGPGQPTVCIPLKLGERVVGVVALFRLLPHRSRFRPHDHDVFGLVARQAAFALCCSDGPWGAGGRAQDG